MNRIGLKIGCLAGAIVIWVQVASTTVTEVDLRMPISVVNLPTGLAISEIDLPPDALVRVRAAKLRVIAHKYLHRPLGRVELDLANRQAGTSFLYEITPADVRTTQEVVAVLPPARLPLRLDRQGQRRVSIHVETTGKLPAGKVLLSPLVAEPREVAVSGPERQLKDARTVVTVPVDLTGLSASQQTRVALVAPAPDVVLEPTAVNVEIAIADLAMRVLADIPVDVDAPSVAAGGDGPDVAVAPRVCDVTVEGPADSVRALQTKDLRVVVDTTLRRDDASRVRARVEHPAWVTRVSVEPATFSVLAAGGTAE